MGHRRTSGSQEAGPRIQRPFGGSRVKVEGGQPLAVERLDAVRGIMEAARASLLVEAISPLGSVASCRI